jgi:hypothetical protein
MLRAAVGGCGRSCPLRVSVPALGALLACGGHATGAPPAVQESADATSIPAPADAGLDARPIAQYPDGPTPGCSACTDAAGADAPDGTGALADQDADANAAVDAICHVAWPQPLYLNVQGIQMAVDASGDVYLAISYDGTSGTPLPSLDLGLAVSPSYPIGVAIAKVDSACHLLWVREIGTAAVDSQGVSSDSIGNTAIAVDAQSNVIIMGAFTGNIDFSGTTLGIPDASGLRTGASFPYLMGFDPSGQVRFRQVLQPTVGYEEMSAGSLAVSPGGTSTLAVWEASPSAAIDGATGVAAHYIVQFDGTGQMVFQSTPSMADPEVGPGGDMVTDPAGGFWAVGGPGNGVTSPYSTSMVFHLSSTGDVTWTQPVSFSSAYPLFSAGAGRAYVLDVAYGGVLSTETLRSYPSSGTSPWTQVTQASYAGTSFAQQMVVDANGDAIVGGEFTGSIVTSADGSTTTAPSPSGAGFQAFDSTGHLRSVKTWNEAAVEPPPVLPTEAPAPEYFGAVAVDPQGDVLLAGTVVASGPGPSVFLVKLAQ